MSSTNTAAPVSRRGQFSNGLVATSSGMAPRNSHPGLRASQHEGFDPQTLHHLPTAEAKQNMQANSCDSLNTSNIYGSGAVSIAPKQTPVRRRHLDPNHFTDLSDNAKRAEGRLGRAHVKPPPSSLTARAGNATQPLDPRNVETIKPDVGRVQRYRNLGSSVEQAEARLRSIAAGRGLNVSTLDEKQQQRYREAARQTLAEYRGFPDIVEHEQALAYRMASDAYANESGSRRATTEALIQKRYAGGADRAAAAGKGPLGESTAGLQSSTPFALEVSAPRADTNTSVTGSHSIQISKQHNRDHFTSGGVAVSATAMQVAPESDAQVACEEQRRQQNGLHYEHRGMKGPRPFDDEVVSSARYPSPPPVGVSVGVYQKPMLVRQMPERRRNIVEDGDTLAMKRARAANTQLRKNDEGASPERPEHPSARTEVATGAAPQRQPSLRERTEGRWKAQEEERAGRQLGRTHYARESRPTALW